MDIQEDLKKYKNIYRLYTSFLDVMSDDNLDIVINCHDNDDNNSKINFLIYKSDYKYIEQEILNEMFYKDELQFINFDVNMNTDLANKLINLIRHDFINFHKLLLPCFDRDNNQVLPSTTNTLIIKINNQEQLKDANEVYYELIRKKKRN